SSSTSLRPPRSTCASSPRSLQRSRSARCCRSRSTPGGAGEGRGAWLLSALGEPPHDLVELLQISVVDLNRPAGIAVVDTDGESERVADSLLQRDCIGVLALAGGGACLLRLAHRDALDMRELFSLPDVEPFLDNALGGGEWIGHANQRAGMAGG